MSRDKPRRLKLLADIERLAPPIEDESRLIAERSALYAKPCLDASERARLEQLIAIVGPSVWEDEARALLRQAAATLRAETGT